MGLVTSGGFLSKPLIIIKQIDLYVALVIIFKWMQEGLGKDVQKCQLTAGYRHWVMTYALLNKSVSVKHCKINFVSCCSSNNYYKESDFKTIKSVLAHVVS